MNNWNRHELSEIAEIRISNVDKKSVAGEQGVSLCNYMDVYANDYIRSDIPFMEATASLAEIEKFKVIKGDVIITKDSEKPYDIGIPAVVVDDIENLVCGYHLALMKPKTSMVDPVFLSKQLASSQSASYFSKLAAGSTRYGLSNGAIAKTPILLPDIKIQRKISLFLTTLDQTIEKTEALIEKYQQIKAGLMHDLFTRGVTADGKLRPPREQAPELYQQTPIGWIPEDWIFGEIKNFVTSAQYGISTSLSDFESGIPVLRMNNIQSNRFDVSDLKYTHDPEAYRLKLKEGDVLYNRTNSMEHVGKTAIWRNELDICSFASYLVRINLNQNLIIADFFSHWMSQVSSQNALRRYATPAVQQVNINPTNLQRVVIGLPKYLDEQREIVKRIDTIDSKIQAETSMVEKYRKQKNGLMSDLLTGKKPVQVDEEEAAHV